VSGVPAVALWAARPFVNMIGGGASALKSAPAESLRTASTTDPRLSSAGAARALRLEPLVGLG